MARSVCVLSRQRIVGETNGSSIYLLSIVKYLVANGLQVHYVCPSPSVFGRWPFLWLRPEMEAFSSYRIRGAWKFGRLVINPDLRVLLQAAVAVFDVIAARLKLPLRRFGRPASHSIFTPETLREADKRYLAKIARPLADAILCDYASLAPAIAFVGRDDARSAVVMHDLFSAHYPEVDSETEFAWLSLADLIIAIQAKEAGAVSTRLPHTQVIVAPMALTSVEQAQPGDSDQLLFVGSYTAPNIEALNWFLRKVWPLVRERRTSLRLQVAGAVCRGVSETPDGVSLLGLVDDLRPLYRQAGVVISPLRSGTGLKIKLIEALSQGKAVIATSATTFGVEELMQGAVVVADPEMAFAEGVLELAQDERRRLLMGEQGIGLVRRHFSPEACYRGIYEFLSQTKTAAP